MENPINMDDLGVPLFLECHPHGAYGLGLFSHLRYLPVVAPVGATISTLFPVRWPIKCVDGQIGTKKLIYLPAASPVLEASKSIHVDRIIRIN